jgi:putative addiction module killer protein
MVGFHRFNPTYWLLDLLSYIYYNYSMEIRPRIIHNYQTKSGSRPFREWLIALKDIEARAAIRVRINRLRLGNLGDCRHLGDRIYELRIHHGPGYRIYFGDLDGENVVLLCGGSKRTQKKDIEKAREYWQEFRSENHE